MALQGSSMTRSSSSDSSALSNILVAGAKEDDGASDRISASTPPTSLNDNGSTNSAKAAVDAMDVIEEETGRRPRRARSSGVSTYSLKQLSDAAQQPQTSQSRRNVSGLTGETLVDGEEDGETPFRNKVDKALDMDWELSAGSPQRRSPRQLQRRPSVKDRVKKAAGKVGSVLGKRSREVVEKGKRRLGMGEQEESPKMNKVLKELDTGTKGVLDEMDLSDDELAIPPPRPAKKAKTSGKAALLEAPRATLPTAPPVKISSGRRVKKWQREGLYVGQDPDLDPSQPAGRKKLQKKRPESSGSDGTVTSNTTTTKHSFMGLPMFNYLEKTRDFTIPFDIYAPSYKKGDEKPKDWFKINRNRLIGEAKELWEKQEKLPASACVCQPPAPGEQGCEDDCLNRVMQYECNDDNCSLPASQCSNRSFAELAARTKKSGAFDLGVEVIKTGNRGFGVRSCRTFTPGQIIMEYTGEIISEGECQRRMREDYKDKQCYYLMELERGLIIDGTKGSMARFINHSCAPNCEVRMMKVNGTPRMAVFAGDDGVMTGEELTYDYNFDNFGTVRQICYCGAPTCRGFLSKRLNAAEQKKLAKEESEKKRKAAEQAQKHAAEEERKKKVKTARGSSWRGWVAVDDPETKERLRAEKKAREEAEMSSSRARRMAARRGSLPAAEEHEPLVKKEPKRRRTVQLHQETNAKMSDEPEEEGVEVTVARSETAAKKRKTDARAVSTGSKFTEELSRPTTAQTTSTTIVKQTEVSISTTEVREETTRLLDEDGLAVASAEDEVIAKPAEKSGLHRTASKGKEVIKSMGQAVKSSLKGAAGGSVGAGGKLKQTTLSFAKMG